MGGAKAMEGAFDELPEWRHLTTHFDCTGLELDLAEEIDMARKKLESIS